MSKKDRITIEEENLYRLTLRKKLITLGTPIAVMLILGIAVTVFTILSTFFAAKDFNKGHTEEAIDKINFSSYTSAFVEGYKAKYNYATAIAPIATPNAINLYATEIMPISPPDFICYPASNGMHYSTILGDQAMQNLNFLEAEYYYNYSEYFIMSAPDCFNGAGGESGEESENGGEGDSESESNSKDGSGSEKELEKIREKQNQAREAQGKESKSKEDNKGRPTEEQIQQNEERAESSKQSQRQTEDLRDAEKSGERNYTDKPW